MGVCAPIKPALWKLGGLQSHPDPSSSNGLVKQRECLLLFKRFLPPITSSPAHHLHKRPQITSFTLRLSRRRLMKSLTRGPRRAGRRDVSDIHQSVWVTVFSSPELKVNHGVKHASVTAGGPAVPGSGTGAGTGGRGAASRLAGQPQAGHRSGDTQAPPPHRSTAPHLAAGPRAQRRGRSLSSSGRRPSRDNL